MMKTNRKYFFVDFLFQETRKRITIKCHLFIELRISVLLKGIQSNIIIVFGSEKSYLGRSKLNIIIPPPPSSSVYFSI